jgi:hypothetical protein
MNGHLSGGCSEVGSPVAHQLYSHGTPPHAAPSTPSTPTTPHSGQQLGSSYPYGSTPATPTTPGSYSHQPSLQLAHPSSSTPSTPSTPLASGHQGPQPISPPPPAPQISAAELSLLTEASATKNGTFQCTLCSKQFGYKNGLIRHVRLTHVGEKPYQCNICNRRFGYKHILMEHQNLHFGNRPYACNLCDKRFAARSNLIQHRMVHKRPFNCALCNKRFDREDQLKKHLFAHPQSLLMCSLCKYNGSSQLDINKHMLEAHHSHLPLESMQMSPPEFSGDESDMPTVSSGQIDSTMPPDSSDDHMPGGLNSAAAAAAHIQAALDSRTGHRIDAICSQLSTSVAGTYNHHLQHQPQLGFPYHDVVVKKELVDTTGNPGEDQTVSSLQNIQHSPRFSSSSDLHYPTSSAYDPFSWASRYTNPTSSASSGVGSSYGMEMPNSAKTTYDEKPILPSATLPGIHEVFSKRNQKLPSFANFMPLQMKVNLPLPDLTMSMLQSPPAPATSFTSAASVVNPTQRPTAQLPPITHTLRQTKDQAIQHSLSIAGFPSLDDVLSYYISQGRLFKCQHCNILFFERGMYFLHASLHGLTSPWECSICHKLCSDKNEFTLHFVNQQHNNS